MVREPISKEFWNWEHVAGQAFGAVTAGNSASISLKQDNARLQGTRMSKIRWYLEWLGKTNAQGPIWFGLSWNMLDAVLAEAMNADPQSDQDVVEMEEIRRNLIVLGMVPQRSAESGEPGDYLMPASFRTARLPSWDLIEGAQLRFWWMVPLGGVNLSTGATFSLSTAIKEGWLSD